MKTVICFFALSFLSISYADCVSAYNAGVMSAKKGDVGANRSQELFEQMKDLASNNASIEEMCNIGSESRMASFIAAKSYKNARLSFLDAINLCASPNDEKAANFADQSTTAYNTSAQFIAQMDMLLSNKCSAKPLTPFLN